MPRKKKEQTKEVTEKVRDFGTGLTRINNMLQAGYRLEDIREEQKNDT